MRWVSLHYEHLSSNLNIQIHCGILRLFHQHRSTQPTETISVCFRFDCLSMIRPTHSKMGISVSESIARYTTLIPDLTERITRRERDPDSMSPLVIVSKSVTNVEFFQRPLSIAGRSDSAATTFWMCCASAGLLSYSSYPNTSSKLYDPCGPSVPLSRASHFSFMRQSAARSSS